MLKDFPFQAIRKAAELGEYTLTDRGTWCAIESTVRDELTTFVCNPKHPASYSLELRDRAHTFILSLRMQG